MKSTLEDLAKIQNVDALTSALAEAGYEYSCTSPSHGGAILQETWVHATEGAYSFYYEHGSKVVADPDNY